MVPAVAGWRSRVAVVAQLSGVSKHTATAGVAGSAWPRLLSQEELEMIYSSSRVVMLVAFGIIAAIEGNAWRMHRREAAQLRDAGLPPAEELAELIPNYHHLWGSRNPALYPWCPRSFWTGESMAPPSGTCLIDTTCAAAQRRLLVPQNICNRCRNSKLIACCRRAGDAHHPAGLHKTDFGQDIIRHGWGAGDWPALCSLDSDRDGVTNGQELGDPCCAWRGGDEGGFGSGGADGYEGSKFFPLALRYFRKWNLTHPVRQHTALACGRDLAMACCLTWRVA